MSYMSIDGAVYEIWYEIADYGTAKTGWYWQLRCEDPAHDAGAIGPFETKGAAREDARGWALGS